MKNVRWIASIVLILIFFNLLLIFVIPFKGTATEFYNITEEYTETERFVEEPYGEYNPHPFVQGYPDGEWSGGQTGSGTYDRTCILYNKIDEPIRAWIEMNIGCNEKEIKTVMPKESPMVVGANEKFVLRNSEVIPGACSHSCKFVYEAPITRTREVTKQRLVTIYYILYEKWAGKVQWQYESAV